MFRKAVSFVSVLAAVLALAMPAISRADTLASSTITSINGQPRLVTYSGAINEHDQWGAYGFGYFCWLDDAGALHWLSAGVVNAPTNVAVEGTSTTVLYAGYMDDDFSQPVFALLKVEGVAANETSFAPVEGVKVSLQVVDYSTGMTKLDLRETKFDPNYPQCWVWTTSNKAAD